MHKSLLFKDYEKNLMLGLFLNLYKKDVSDLPYFFNLNKFMNLCVTNKISLLCLNKIQDFDHAVDNDLMAQYNIIKEKIEKRKQSRFNSIKALNDILDDGYLLIKTFRGGISLGHDLDIYVPDLIYAVNKLKKYGFHSLSSVNYDKHKYSLIKPGYMELDIHDRVSWGSLRFIDEEEILWNNLRVVSMDGLSCQIPGIEGDILTNLAHINFQTYSLCLGDLKYVSSLLPKANMNILLNETSKFHWKAAFIETLSKINSVNMILKTMRNYHDLFDINDNLTFPLLLSADHVARALKQKGVLNLIKLISYYSLSPYIPLRLKSAFSYVVIHKLAKIHIQYGLGKMSY